MHRLVLGSKVCFFSFIPLPRLVIKGILELSRNTLFSTFVFIASNNVPKKTFAVSLTSFGGKGSLLATAFI